MSWCPIARVYGPGCGDCNLNSGYHHECKFLVAYKEALAVYGAMPVPFPEGKQ